MASLSAYGVTHPPRSNPPLRSSSGPPSPCITPSTVTIVMVVSFMGSSFLSWWSFSFDRTEARNSSVERGSVLQAHSASFPNILLVHRDPRQVAALACQFVPEARVFLLALKQRPATNPRGSLASPTRCPLTSLASRRIRARAGSVRRTH